MTAPLAMIGFAILGVYFSITRAQNAAQTGRGDVTSAVLSHSDGLTVLLGRAADVITIIALIVITAMVAAEWSQGTLRNLLVREPGRLRLLAGKFLAILVFVLLSAAVAVAVGIGVGFAAGPGHGIDTAAWTSSAGVTALWHFAGNLALGLIAWSVIGLLIAVVTRSAAAAVGVALAYAIPVEGLITHIWQDAPRWLPGQLINAVLVSGNAVTTYARALLLITVYALAAALIAAALFRRGDVTA